MQRYAVFNLFLLGFVFQIVVYVIYELLHQLEDRKITKKKRKKKNCFTFPLAGYNVILRVISAQHRMNKYLLTSPLF
jgi:hypothetical protein